MIHQLTGTIIAIDTNAITLQPQASGIGFGVIVPHKELYTINQVLTLFTYVHWNQEQGPTLYGFTQELERSIFLLIIGCSGIGPKIGLASLETLPPQELVRALYEENIQVISSVPGIGKKKAEQIIVTLKHKIGNLIENKIPFENSSIKHWQQITEVLLSLNYSRQEINHAIQHLKLQHDSAEVPFDMFLRKALSFLSKLR